MVRVTEQSADESDAGSEHGRGREPWWFVGAKRTDLEDEWAVASVESPTEDDARAEGSRVIAAGEGTDAFEVRSVRGPFPRSPGESAPTVRPKSCAGCGLHCWPGDRPPCPNSTWFTRDEEQSGGDSVAWQCIQCGTMTRIPNEMVGAER